MVFVSPHKQRQNLSAKIIVKANYIQHKTQGVCVDKDAL